jgi:hypothetical protein
MVEVGEFFELGNDSSMNKGILELQSRNCPIQVGVS